MNIEKNKTFILELTELGNCYAIYITKNNKDYILIRKEEKRLFKICLNTNNETEYYEKKIALTDRLKQEIFKKLEDKITYINTNFNIDDFFVEIEPLQIPRSKMRYSLYVDGSDDYLNKYEFVGKSIEIQSNYFDELITVFIYREKNLLIYAIMSNNYKIAKYVFKLENDILELIKEENYNGYKPLEFMKFKEDFHNLTTTCHQMQRDISSKDENVIYAMKLYKKAFGIE